MKRSSIPSHMGRDEKKKPPRVEDFNVSRSRDEEEKLRRRREWQIQKEREKEHERLKQKMILDYEIRRARQQGLEYSKGRCSQRSRSKSRSRSSETRHRRTSSISASKPPVMSEKTESSCGKAPLFKGPEGTKISAVELKKIKVDIHRNIPVKATTSRELQRDIVNPEDVILKRRDGEGTKPIFERDELKIARIKSEEIEEYRTVVALDSENAVKSHSSKKQSATSSPLRNRSYSPRRISSRHSRHEDLKRLDDRRDHHKNDKSDRDRNRSAERSRDRSRGRSRERRERYKEPRRYSSHTVDEDRLRADRRDHSCSRYRDERQWERNSHRRSMKNEAEYRDYRERSREHSRERREEERLRDRRLSAPHYIEHVPVPVYYGNFPLRPIVVGPMVPLRGQVPLGRGRHPQLMGPVRSFPPRFLPPDMYRIGAPPNPRFGPIL